jgi:hypothetical protein
VVHALAGAGPRDRVAVVGHVVGVEGVLVGPSPSLRVEVEDGTGALDLVFVGRAEVPGLRPGVSLRLEGTVQCRRGRLEVWNPSYELLGRRGD